MNSQPESTVLEIDGGNTRFKWRVRRGSEVLEQGCWNSVPAPQQLPAHLVDVVRVVSVRSDDETLELTGVLQQWSQAPVSVARVSEGVSGLKCAYADPNRLGTDRWVALLGALGHVEPPFMVIDAGSAITLDLVDAQRIHIGGYIQPGYRLCHEALRGGTAGVRPEPALAADCTAPGASTDACVDRGVRLMVSGAVEKLARAHPSCALLFTGGDAERLLNDLESTLRARARWIPELVLDGLEPALEGI